MDVGNQRQGSCREGGPAKGEVWATLAAQRSNPSAYCQQRTLSPLQVVMLLGGTVEKDVDAACSDKASDRSSFFFLPRETHPGPGEKSSLRGLALGNASFLTVILSSHKLIAFLPHLCTVSACTGTFYFLVLGQSLLRATATLSSRRSIINSGGPHLAVKPSKEHLCSMEAVVVVTVVLCHSSLL